MNVIVFGATGRTGRHIVRHALLHGHNVTAFTRSAASIGALTCGSPRVT